MAKKSKDARVQVILECTEHKASGMPGFANASFFAKYFKAATGVTPRKYLLN